MTTINTVGADVDILADSRQPFELWLAFQGQDVSTATFEGQVRLYPNQAGGVDPLARFVFTPVLVSVESGTTISRLKAVLDEAVIEALPTGAEPTGAASFYYDIQMTLGAKRRLCGGTFTVRGGVTNG